MLFSLFNTFFNVIIVVLFIRYFIEKYQYYGFGPIMISIVTLTERIMQPLKNLVPWGHFRLQDQIPLLAIGITIVLRGLVMWLLGTGGTHDLIKIHGVVGSIPLAYAMAISLSMGIALVSEMLIAFLFASLMVSRRGLTLSGNAGFICFQEKTFEIFRLAKRFIRVDDLALLFMISSCLILLLGSFFASLSSLSFFYGVKAFNVSWIITLFDILFTLIYVYSLVLILSVLSTWFSADPFSVSLQILRAMTEPYLNIFRRLLPFARIDFIDLSPIFGFLLINPLLTGLILHFRNSLLSSVLTSPIRGTFI